MTRMEEVRHRQRHWTESGDIYSAGDGRMWVKRDSDTYRAVEAARRPGESFDDCFNRIIREGLARLDAMTPEEQDAFFAPIPKTTDPSA